MYLELRCVLFFFSSRRRHTRYWRDWSSDVCSSDLSPSGRCYPDPQISDEVGERRRAYADATGSSAVMRRNSSKRASRSEERRVGKECRSRGSPYHLKKK